MRIIKTFISDSEDKTREVAKFMVNNVLKSRKKCIVFLEGDLGSGKTTFVRFALEFLGISEDKFNGSPTFTVINEYENNIYHVDLYRVNDGDFLSDYFMEEGIFFIEWPDKLDIKPDCIVRFEIISDNGRRIDVYTG